MLRPTGIVRRVIRNGVFAIPAPLRHSLDISEGSYVDIYADGGRLVIERHRSGCVFCGEWSDGLIEHRDRYCCPRCLRSMNRAARAS